MEVGFGGEWMHVYVWLSPFAVHLKLTTLLISYVLSCALSLSRVRLFVIPCTLCEPTRLLCPWDSPGKNTRVGSLSLLQGIFPIQELNRGLLHCRRILYQLSYKGSPNQLYSNTK